MPCASPSTPRRWVRADLVPEDDWTPEPEVQVSGSWNRSPEWHVEARCRTVDPKKVDRMFFGETDDPTKTSLTISDIREVKSFCKQCPVFVDCLTHALSTPERHGIWAGTSKRTRQRILTLIDLGTVTIQSVVDDYLEGREKRYESIRSS